MELSRSPFVQRKAHHDHHTEQAARRYRLPAVLPLVKVLGTLTKGWVMRTGARNRPRPWQGE